ncbi:MAG: hypothetical protein JRI86_00980 [Deltaproteobacteria bacterium]|nr:hypothetical protein [Deltaproteobacteria bacterium]
MKFRKRHVFNLFFTILLFFTFNSLGCGNLGTGNQKDSDQFDSGKTNPENLELKKRVIIAPLIDQEGVGNTIKVWITATAVYHLGKEGHLIISKETGNAPSTKELSSPLYGMILDPDMAERAEEMGMDMLISVVLNPFDVIVKKRGIWPFRRYKMDVEISMSISVLDIVSGTILMCNQESEMFRIPGSVEKNQELKWKPDDRLFFKFASYILEDQAVEVLDVSRDKPWTGRIVGVNDNMIEINGGQDIGLIPGGIFEVYGMGESITSADGKEYFFRGPKIGEIITEKNMADSSISIPLTGSQFKVGQIVKYK